MRKLRYVDALRGLAITGGLFAHCGQTKNTGRSTVLPSSRYR
jgi:hypothetical protein